MIRYVVGLFVFAVALCAYIVNLPRDDGRRAAIPATQPSEVSRGGAAAPLALPSAGQIAAQQRAPLPFATTNDPLGLTVANVLIGLGFAPDTLGPVGARARGPESGLELMVLQALQARMTDDQIDARINDAARLGDLFVPDVLVRADARVDSATLLAAIIARADRAAGNPAPTPVALADQPGLDWVGDDAFHTVQPGESLAALAGLYLGDATRTDVLLVANATVLTRADQIAPGLRLLIPGR